MSGWLITLALLGQLASAPLATQTRDREQASTDKRLEIAGQVSALADVLPRREVGELRPQAELEVTFRASSLFRMKFDGFVEGLVADRAGRVSEAAGRIREAWIEVAGSKGDLRAGYGRIIWGRLDEIQPSDVINPLDTARYLFDGRGAARLPVAFVRGRLFASEGLVLEGVLAPAFRRGTFDELQERSSPFNLLNDLVLPATIALTSTDLLRLKPERNWANVSGGGRLSGTVGRVDLSVGAFRGFDSFGLISFDPDISASAFLAPAVVGRLVQRFPRFTMVSADFETVTGEWAWRGEAAMFVDKTFSGSSRPGVVKGKALDAGIGFDRRTGKFRLFGSAILHREWSAEDAGIARTDVSFVGSIERQFGRERYLARVFGVVNPGDASAFLRGLFVWRVRDSASIEGSAAAFLGDGDDMLARFKTRDFLLIRVRWRF